jgi:hypothetical protein
MFDKRPHDSGYFQRGDLSKRVQIREEIDRDRTRMSNEVFLDSLKFLSGSRVFNHFHGRDVRLTAGLFPAQFLNAP